MLEVGLAVWKGASGKRDRDGKALGLGMDRGRVKYKRRERTNSF